MAVILTKKCSRCGVEKPRSDYYEDKGKWPSQCKECQRERSREYYGRTPERRRQVARDSQRRARLREYGITPDEYNAMWVLQGGRCRICQREADLQVDHCHDTGKVRGLLCGPCNKALGLLRDDVTTLLAAVSYLKPDPPQSTPVVTLRAPIDTLVAQLVCVYGAEALTEAVAAATVTT